MLWDTDLLKRLPKIFFSQIRKTFGVLPNAKEASIAVRLISESQYVSDVRRTNYMSESDVYPLDFCKEQTAETKSISQPVTVTLACKIQSSTASKVINNTYA